MKRWQQEALPYLDKLFDPRGNRQTGRTYLIALALIRAACRNPGVRIPFIDHHDNNNNARRIVRRYVEIMVGTDSALREHYSANDLSFVLKLREPIEDWLLDAPEDLGDVPTIWERLTAD